MWIEFVVRHPKGSVKINCQANDVGPMNFPICESIILCPDVHGKCIKGFHFIWTGTSRNFLNRLPDLSTLLRPSEVSRYRWFYSELSNHYFIQSVLSVTELCIHSLLTSCVQQISFTLSLHDLHHDNWHFSWWLVCRHRVHRSSLMVSINPSKLIQYLRCNLELQGNSCIKFFIISYSFPLDSDKYRIDSMCLVTDRLFCFH